MRLLKVVTGMTSWAGYRKRDHQFSSGIWLQVFSKYQVTTRERLLGSCSLAEKEGLCCVFFLLCYLFWLREIVDSVLIKWMHVDHWLDRTTQKSCVLHRLIVRVAAVLNNRRKVFCKKLINYLLGKSYICGKMYLYEL